MASTNTELVLQCHVDEQSSEVYACQAAEEDERKFSKKGSVATSTVDQCQSVREVL